jgi:hypothetical protein
MVFVAMGSHSARAQSALKTIDNPQGGKIVYGRPDGVASQAAAMSTLLRMVHNNCDERPLIGKVFRARGTNSAAVFFTVVNHARGDRPIAGLVIASLSGPNGVEAALISDDAARFGSTVNPMLAQLFAVWRPGGGAAQPPGTAAGARSAPPAALHPVTAADNSASVGIPDGWQAKGSQGTMLVSGPNGESVGLDYTRLAADPNGPGQRQFQRYGNNNSGKIIYPANVDLPRAFPDLFQEFWRVNGGHPTGLQIAHAEQVPGPPGQRCAHVTGYVNLSGMQGEMEEMNALLCTTTPGPMGNYLVMLSMALLPPAVADKERATVGAILASFQANQAVVAGQANAMAAPAIAAIHAIGRDAANRAAEADRQHDIQHRAWENDQDNKAGYNQGFSNYLLDQTVIQDNYLYTHETVWNRTADLLVKADPNRYEIVDTPNYWKGWDF